MSVTSLWLPKACFGVVLLLPPFPAFAGIVTNSASLPPLVGSYVTMAGVHACFETAYPSRSASPKATTAASPTSPISGCHSAVNWSFLTTSSPAR